MMVTNAVVVASQLVGLGAAGVSVGAAVAARRRQRPYAPGAFVEPVAERVDPVREALRHGCAGVAVRLHVDRDPQRPAEDEVRGPAGTGAAGPALRFDAAGAALRFDAAGAALRLDAAGAALRIDAPGRPSLRGAVFAPLAERVAAHGTVHPGVREQFVLVVQASARACQALDEALAAYPQLFTSASRGVVRPGPVTVVLRGGTLPAGALVTRATRRVFLEATFDDLGRTDLPPALAPLVSEDIRWRLGWDGTGAMPAEERHLLRWLVRSAHAEGRRVHLSGLPRRWRPRLAYWRELRAAGVDLIGDGRLPGVGDRVGQWLGGSAGWAPHRLSLIRAQPVSTR